MFMWICNLAFFEKSIGHIPILKDDVYLILKNPYPSKDDITHAFTTVKTGSIRYNGIIEEYYSRPPNIDRVMMAFGF